MGRRRALSWVWFVLQLAACADEGVDDSAAIPVLRSNALVRGRSNFVGVFTPETATWKLKMQRPGWAGEPAPDLEFHFGASGAVPVVGDWDGNGSQTQGAWQAGTWSLANTLAKTEAELSFVYGAAGDTPIAGDWDGDGRASPGLYRDGVFSLRNENSAGAADARFRFGRADDRPVVGDWDGDGVDSVGVYRPSDATFHLINRNGGGASVTTYRFGVPVGGAQPVIGDWDESGVSTIGLRNGRSWRLRDHNQLQWTHNREEPLVLGEISVNYGEPGDVPVVGNWHLDARRGYVRTEGVLGDFFPLAADYQPPEAFQKWKDRGLNTVVRVPVGVDPEAWTREANRLGLKMIRPARDNPVDDNGEVNLLAFIIKDEPEVDVAFKSLPDPYPDLAGIVASLRAPAVVQRPVFMNFAGAFVLNHSDPFHGPGDDGEDWYSRFIALEDWVSQDIYPLGQMRAREKMGEQDAMDTLPLTMDKLRRWAPTKPQFAYVESSQSDASPNLPPLEARLFKAQVWSVIVHGARGIFYFPHGSCNLDCGERDVTPPDVVVEMLAQNRRITALASVLQGAVNPAHFAVTAAKPLDVGWRDHLGEKVVIAVNYSAQSVQRWLRIDGVPPLTSIEVVDESRTVEIIAGTSFQDEFEPYAVHIYRFR